MVWNCPSSAATPAPWPQAVTWAPDPMNDSVVLVRTGTITAAPTASPADPETLPERRSSAVASWAATRRLPWAVTVVAGGLAIGWAGSLPMKARVVGLMT